MTLPACARSLSLRSHVRQGRLEEGTSAKLALVAVVRLVPLDLDPKRRVSQPNPVARRRAKHARICLATELERRNGGSVGGGDGRGVVGVQEAARDYVLYGLVGESRVGEVARDGGIEEEVAAW